MDFEIFLKAAAAADDFDLDGDGVVIPPDADYGYNSTPRNALTFAVMGCDGVHYAILTLDGRVRDDSPVIQVSPMDSKDVLVLAPNFVEYLADGCEVSTDGMAEVLESERLGEGGLLAFLGEHFRSSRLLSEERTDELMDRFSHWIDRKHIVNPDIPPNLIGSMKVFAGSIRAALSNGATPEALDDCSESLTRVLELAVEFEESVTEGELDKHLELVASLEESRLRIKEIHQHADKRRRMKHLGRIYNWVDGRLRYMKILRSIPRA